MGDFVGLFLGLGKYGWCGPEEANTFSLMSIRHFIFYSFSSVAMLSFSSSVSALDYYWFLGSYPEQRYSSAAEACRMGGDRHAAGGYNMVPDKTVITPSVPYYEDKPFFCYMDWHYANNPGVIYRNLYLGYVFKRGDTCSVGVYNPTTGECANDSDKGPPPNSCPTGYAGNPINTAVGNKFQAETDYASNGSSMLSFTRFYNSLDGLWRHNHSTYLRVVGPHVSLVMAHGGEHFFSINGSKITAAPSELGQLMKITEGWLYISENNERFTFDASGRLIQWMNSSGAKHLLTYAAGKVTVTDRFGQSLSLAEDTQHQPLSLTVGELQISYSYNANKRLIKLVRTRAGLVEQRQYHYEDSRNSALLTGITDERGVRYATWTYDDQGRAISSEHAAGAERTQVAYNADGSSTVTNELGKNTIYRFANIGGIKRVSAVEGESSANCPNSNSSFTYDSRGLLKTRTDNKGFLTTYDYNDRGLEVSRTEASGTPQARTITTEWHPSLFLPLVVTESDRIIRYQYDEQGRQLGRTVETR